MTPLASRFRLAALAAAGLLLSLPVSAAGRGAAIFIAGDASGDLTVWDGVNLGAQIDSGSCGYSVLDGFAVGDVDGDGEDEVVVAGDASGIVDVFRLGGATTPRWSFDGHYTVSDALAVGDVLGLGYDQILIAGDVSNDVEIYTPHGDLLATFDVGYTISDGFAVGDVVGDGKDEILVAGDVSGDVDIFSGTGASLGSFDGDFSIADGFAAGDVDGDGKDEILVAGDVSGVVDIFEADGTKIRSLHRGYSISDGFAVGDVDGNGVDDIAIAGDVSGNVDVFTMDGDFIGFFAGGFTISDGFAIGRSKFPDADGDGLLDSWETYGFDADGDGTIDVDLPSMGARPDHPDLFLEFDWVNGQEPTRYQIQTIKAAFAQAPLGAGGIASPDGQPGINLHVDTGTLTDPTASEGMPVYRNSCSNGVDDDNDGLVDSMDDTCVEGSGNCNDGIDNDGDGRADVKDPKCREGLNACSDGVDNDGDGITDLADPDCVVGDQLGGGNGVAGPVDCISTSFYATKAANFDPIRKRVFRYAISGNPADSTCNGGRGELGGNDFIEFNHDPGTMMHELGHNLGLGHGGDSSMNCKPNYVSVMNYDDQFGINRTDGSRIIDYSPPRHVDGTRTGALPAISEDQLDVPFVLDAGDPDTMLVYTDYSGDKVNVGIDADIDWDNTGASFPASAVNVDTADNDGNPADCANSSFNSTLTGHDDWTVISMPFRAFGAYDDAGHAVNPVLTPEPSLTQLVDQQRKLDTTDLSANADDSVDPAVAGGTLAYALDLSNAGKNPSHDSELRATIPAGLSAITTPGCTLVGSDMTCDVEFLRRGQHASFGATFAIAPDLVYVAGAPVTLHVTATAHNVAGGDPNAANDASTEDTLVLAKADLDVLGASLAPAGADVLIGEPAAATLLATLTSHGPSSPMDVRLDRVVTSDPGATLSLSVPTSTMVALHAGETRDQSTDVTIACSTPGAHALSVTTSAHPARPDDVDPNAANDDASASFAVQCVVPVKIHVAPALNASRRGVVPVEIFTTAAGEDGLPIAFDASSIDATSVRFGTKAGTWSETSGASEAHGSVHGSGNRAVTMHFPMQSTGLADGDAEGCVKGTYRAPDGNTYEFFGCDGVSWSGR